MADVDERFYAMQMQKRCKRLDIWGSSMISLSDLALKEAHRANWCVAMGPRLPSPTLSMVPNLKRYWWLTPTVQVFSNLLLFNALQIKPPKNE